MQKIGKFVNPMFYCNKSKIMWNIRIQFNVYVYIGSVIYQDSAFK